MARGWKGLILLLVGVALALGSIQLCPTVQAGMSSQQIWRAMPVLFRLLTVAGFICGSYGIGMLLGAVLSQGSQ